MELYYPLILDGATGTQLQKRGFSGDICTEQWVLEHPAAIMEVQKNYAAAGSNIVYAPTFSANAVKLEEYGIFNQVADYNKRLVAISKEAAADGVLVAGDLSPTGKFLAPVGDLAFEDLVEIYREQAAALEEANVDLFVVETMMTVSDARAAVLAIREVSSKPVFVSFTCDENGRTVFGSDIVAVLQIMQGMEIDAFGLNCSVGPEDMLTQLKRLQEYSELPLIAKPNAGMPETVGGITVYNCPPDDFAAVVPAFAEAGVCVFGGCCGTDERYIAKIAEALKSADIKKPHPLHPELLPAASGTTAYALQADVRCTLVLDVNEGLSAAVEELPGEEDQLLGLRLVSDESLDYLSDAQVAIRNPVCFMCEDAGLLEKALRIYQGRALYEGPLQEKMLLPLRKKYGLIY